jgi:hypothetical protein
LQELSEELAASAFEREAGQVGKRVAVFLIRTAYVLSSSRHQATDTTCGPIDDASVAIDKPMANFIPCNPGRHPIRSTK